MSDSGVALVGCVLMLVSQPASWIAAILWPVEWNAFGFLLPVCAFYWLWSIKNRAFGPIANDGGIISFFPGMVAGGAACAMPSLSSAQLDILAPFCVAGIAMPHFNFLVPIVGFTVYGWHPKKISKSYGKPLYWSVVFYVYCWGSFLYYPAAAAIGAYKSQCTWWAALLGVPLVIVYAAVSKNLVERLNAACIKKKAADEEAPKLEQVGADGGGGATTAAAAPV